MEQTVEYISKMVHDVRSVMLAQIEEIRAYLLRAEQGPWYG